MKLELYIKICILVSLFFVFPFFRTTIFAHDDDNSYSYIYIKEEIDGELIDDTEIIVYTYINWLQSSILVEEATGSRVLDIMELFEHQDIYNQYVLDKFSIKNNGVECPGIYLDSPVTEDQISLSLGTRIITIFSCEETLDSIEVQNSLFLEYFVLPSNYLEIYSGNQLLHAFTMGKDRQIYQFITEDLINNPRGDETRDLSLGFTSDEILSDNTSREYTPKDVRQRSFLQQMSDLVFLRTDQIKNQSLVAVIFLVFMLGLLHTLEAGHSKVILASSLVNQKMNVKAGIGYAGIFTLTHLADIVIVGILFVVADNFLDIFSRFSQIETWAGYALLITASYILIRNFVGYRKAKSEEQMTAGIKNNNIAESQQPHTLKEQLALGFISGLAPCIFGWSIFMLIIATGNSWWLVPVILAFGFGIFIALLVVVFIVTRLRNTAYGKFQKFAKISPLLSGIFLFIYALVIIF